MFMRRVAGLMLLSCAGAVTARGQASLSGAVYDSTAGRPLGGAMVQLVKRNSPWESRTVTTDNTGAFRFDGVAVGEYLLGFQHSRLLESALESPISVVTVRSAEPIRTMLSVPGPRTLAALHCKGFPEGTGLWMGRVRSAENGTLVAAAGVEASWVEYGAEGKSVVQRQHAVVDSSHTDGLFRLCGVPIGSFVYAQATRQADTSGMLMAALESPLLQRDIYIAPATIARRALRPDSASSDTATLMVDVRTGNGVLSGRVVARNGLPIQGAHVRLTETGREVVANDAGYFRLDSLPLGSWSVDVRAVGYGSALRMVDILTEPGTDTFVLDPRQALLDTVRVTAQRLVDSRWHSEFLQRRRRGFGTFLDGPEIERRNPFYVTDLVRMVPGVLIAPGPFGGRVYMRGTSMSSSYCTPDVFLDGVSLIGMDGALETAVSPSNISAIEVYSRSGQVPMEFQRNMSGCGALVIWTGPRTSWKLP